MNDASSQSPFIQQNVTFPCSKKRNSSKPLALTPQPTRSRLVECLSCYLRRPHIATTHLKEALRAIVSTTHRIRRSGREQCGQRSLRLRVQQCTNRHADALPSHFFQ